MSFARSSTRTLRTASRLTRQQIRANSTQSAGPAASPASSSFGGAVLGGLVGGAVASYGLYHFSGAKDIVGTAQQTKDYFDKATASLKENAASALKEAPDSNEAIEYVRKRSLAIAGLIPGASSYVEKAFADLDKIRAKHGPEVEKIVKELQSQLQKIASEDKTSATEKAQKGYTAFVSQFDKVRELAGDITDDVVSSFPEELKTKIGVNFETLKSKGDAFGADAKKKVNDTWTKISGVLKNGKGISEDNVKQIKEIVQSTQEELQKFGDEAYKKGLEQAKPYLDKAPEVKELVEKNAKKVIEKGDLKTFFEKVQESAKAGNTEAVEKYVKELTK